jgi:hypothetical protein
MVVVDSSRIGFTKNPSVEASIGDPVAFNMMLLGAWLL